MDCCERRGRAVAAAVALASCVLTSACEKPTAAPSEPHDLLILTIDTLRADRLGCYGNARGLTPNLDRIAREGTRFAHALSPMPCTAAAHAAIFTGLSPRRNGVTSNFVRASDDLDTLAERLSEQGFATGTFYNAFNFEAINLIQGFADHGFDQSRRAEKIATGFAQWLAATRGQRRFCWIHLYIPHGPLDVPPQYLEQFVQHEYSGPIADDFYTLEKIRSGELAAPPEFAANYRDRYDAAVAFADARVGELRAALEAAGALDSTLLVVVGDHGESLERGVVGLHSPVIRESTLHVPLLVRGPSIPAGRVVDQVVQHMDLLPTVIARLGLPIPAAIDGRDLAPLIDAKPEGAALEWDDRAIATLPTRFEGKSDADPEQAAVRQGKYKLVVKQGNVRELFDLAADPDELKDVASEHPDVVRGLAGTLESWVKSTAAAANGEPVSAEMAEQLRKLGYQ